MGIGTFFSIQSIYSMAIGYEQYQDILRKTVGI